MLAKTEPAERPEQPPAPEEKRRTITLTNGRPVSIKESEWPVIAEGNWSDDYDPQYWETWSIEFRVRSDRSGRYIVHGKYSHSTECEDDFSNANMQTVRVGRVVRASECLEKAMREVADEMRERMLYKNLTSYVTLALDACFAKLGAEVL